METKYLDLFKTLEDQKDNIYVYVRVSTDLQNTDGQLFEVFNYCKKEKLHPIVQNIYVDNGISGYKVSYKDRKIGEILNKCKKESIIIVPELSRMSRNMFESSEIIKFCMDNKITIVDIKNNIKYDGSLQSQLMSQIYGMVSLLEREAISNRVKSAMKKAKNEGKMIGGRSKERLKKPLKNKLDGKHEEIIKLVNDNVSVSKMSKALNVNKSQIRNYLIKSNLYDKYIINK